MKPARLRFERAPHPLRFAGEPERPAGRVRCIVVSAWRMVDRIASPTRAWPALEQSQLSLEERHIEQVHATGGG